MVEGRKMQQKTRGISQDIVEMVAVLTMLTDHFASTYIEQCRLGQYNLSEDILPMLGNDALRGWVIAYCILKLIGRMAFPIFACNIALGARRTGNLKKYFIRVGLLALVSEVPYDLAFFGKVIYPGNQNILFTFSLCLLTFVLNGKINEKTRNVAGIILRCVICGLAMAAAAFLNFDYSFYGVLFVFIIYYFPKRSGRVPKYCRNEEAVALKTEDIPENGNSKGKLIKLGIAFGVLIVYSLGEIFSICSFPLIYFSNGIRKIKKRLFFYLFYPVHLIILYLIILLVGPM